MESRNICNFVPKASESCQNSNISNVVYSGEILYVIQNDASRTSAILDLIYIVD